jgi:hypothetical protein
VSQPTNEKEHWMVFAVRVFWPLTGGLWGAWVGFRGYFHFTYNADSFASVAVLGMYCFTGFLGFLAGVAVTILVGGAIEMGLRRLGLWIPLALLTATLINVLLVFQITCWVESNYPGFRAERPPSRTPGVTRSRGS